MTLLRDNSNNFEFSNFHQIFQVSNFESLSLIIETTHSNRRAFKQNGKPSSLTVRNLAANDAIGQELFKKQMYQIKKNTLFGDVRFYLRTM